MSQPKLENLCLENIWQDKLLKLGWSFRAANQLPLCWAVSTLRQYNSKLRAFQEYCVSNCIDFPPLSTGHIADFYCYLADSSDRPQSTLKSAHASLVAFYEGMGYPNVPSDPTLSKMYTALVKSGTYAALQRSLVMPMSAFQRLFSTWDNSTLSIKDLRLKAVTLLALTAMLRPSDIAPRGVNYDPESHTTSRTLFTVDNIVFQSDGSAQITFRGIKNDTTRTGFQVSVPGSSYVNICPVIALRCYIDRTNSYRPPDGPVFLSLSPPYRALSADSIASILRSSIKLAGLEGKGFTPKDFRPTGATHAAESVDASDVDKVVKLGRWKDKSVFLDHYWHAKPPAGYTDNVLCSTTHDS